MRNIGKILQIFVFAVLLVLVRPALVRAEEVTDEEGGIDETITNTTVESIYADSIVKIVTAYEDEAGNIYNVKQGTGFLIGVGPGASDNSNRKYIVADYGIVEGEMSYVTEIKSKFSLGDAKLTLKYYAVGDMGVLSELKIISYSDETRYVIMEPSTAMADKNPLRLGDGSNIKEQTRVHIEGYNGKRNLFTDTKVADRSIIVYDTSIVKVHEMPYYNDTIVYFTVGESISTGMAGSPVLDESGCVIGMFICDEGFDKPMVMSIDNLRQVFDALAISYMVSTDDSTYDKPTVMQREELKELIVSNKQYISSINKNRYTATTWNALYEAIASADSTYMNSNSTAKQYDDSITALRKAHKKLRTKAFKWKLINVIGLVAIAVITLILTKKLKKRRRLRAQQKIISDMGK